MTTEKQQTPLQKHIEWMKSITPTDDLIEMCIDNAESLLPEERQMVITSTNVGIHHGGKLISTGEQYYNETYL